MLDLEFIGIWALGIPDFRFWAKAFALNVKVSGLGAKR